MTTALPPIQPHTKAKHHILEYHLKEWFPILGNTHRVLRYIDGFAGPGEYQGGGLGSPVISLRTVTQHNSFGRFYEQDKTMEFLFVEKEVEFYRHLKQKIMEIPLPSNLKVDVRHGEFYKTLTSLLNEAKLNDLPMPPTLLFVDPFGPAGFPMDLFKRMAEFDRVDVLINLNHSEFVQWILHDESKHVTANSLYGGPRWKPALRMEGRARTKFLVDEYENALSEIGWRGTSFEMVNIRNQTAYHLVFGTGSTKGLEAMKRAMRSASQTGEFRYTDRLHSAQGVLSGLDRKNEYPAIIGEQLFKKYEGQEVTIEQLTENEINWHRWWLPSDLRDGLKYLEYGEEQRITNVRNSDGRFRRRTSYPDGCLITFGRPQQRRLL